VETCAVIRAQDGDGRHTAIDEVAKRNVTEVVRAIRERSPAIERLVNDGRIGIVGMIYDVASGVAWTVPGTAAGLPPGAIEDAPTPR